MRVLVVEDEPDVAQLFRDYLTHLGHQPVVVHSAEAALAALDVERPDAILLDIQLPGMSGLEFLRLRPVRDAAIPIVAVSGVATESQARECLQLGALDFVGKPVDLDRLQIVIQCLEPLALDRRERLGVTPSERRRMPRGKLAVPVLVHEYSRPEWHAISVDLTPCGIRVLPRDARQSGTTVKVTFALPDGGPPLSLVSVKRRDDAGGITFFFVKPTASESDRLARVVRHLR
jgi:DNA-binding response OmpR family regulator